MLAALGNNVFIYNTIGGHSYIAITSNERNLAVCEMASSKLAALIENGVTVQNRIAERTTTHKSMYLSPKEAQLVYNLVTNVTAGYSEKNMREYTDMAEADFDIAMGKMKLLGLHVGIT